MLDFSISWVPFLGVAALNFFGSWLYYSPMSPFFKMWVKGQGKDPNNMTITEEQKKQMPMMMGGAAVATLVFAYGLMVLVHSLGASTFMDGAWLGFIAWVAFAVSHSLNTQFEGRKPKVLFVNDLWYLITYVVFGGVLAIWK